MSQMASQVLSKWKMAFKGEGNIVNSMSKELREGEGRGRTSRGEYKVDTPSLSK